MTTSALTEVKKLVNISEDNKDFDVDIKNLMNSSLGVIAQSCSAITEVKPVVTGDEQWTDLYKVDPILQTTMMTYLLSSWIPTFVSTDVRLKFDAPINTAVKEALQNCREELLWRMTVVL